MTKRFTKLAAISLALSVAPAAAHETDEPIVVGPYTIAHFDPADYSQETTLCDELAANPDDPDRTAPGLVSSKDIDLAAAMAACHEALAADPDNPRLNYQMGRIYGYSERGDEAMPYRTASVNAGYPQSLFVIGFIHVTGANIEQDVCLGAELIRLSALRGRIAGQVGFPSYVLDGTFDDCQVKKDKAEMLAMLDAAEPNGYYQRLLIQSLEARVSAMEPAD